MSDQPKMPVTLLSWRPLNRNSLRGFASVRVGAALKVNDVAVHRHSHGKAWAQVPSKPVLTSDGTTKKSPDGKVVYSPMLEWMDRGASDRFSEAVIAAIEAGNPGATE